MAMFGQAWILFAVFAALGVVGYNICAKLGGGNLPPVVFAMVMYLAGVIGVLPFFLWFMKDKPKDYLASLPSMPLLFAVGAGLVVIIVDMSIAKMFNEGAPIGVGMSFIFVSNLLLTTILGIVFFKEGYSYINLLGILLAITSIPLMFYQTK